MQDELYDLFRRNFPCVVREEAVARNILTHPENRVLSRRDGQGQLIGAAVVNGNAILLLGVDEAHRRQGLGSALLEEAEAMIRQGGHGEIVVGCGFDYLAPGVPTSQRYVPAVNERLYDGLDDSASRFFEHRGYAHSWGGNCFDMRFPLREFPGTEHAIGDVIDGVSYRWATPEDIPAVIACVDDACREFTPYYRNPWLYDPNSRERTLIATCGGEVAGALIVSIETECEGLGSVGCTAVRTACRGRHIAVNLVTLGTAHLKERGLGEAYLGYTYSGLDYLYGLAGYRVCVYYMMAKKKL